MELGNTKKEFNNNTKITSVVIEKTVKSIEGYALYGCNKLKTITINAKCVVDIKTNAINGI